MTRCAATIRFFRWRAGLVMQAMQREGLAEELAQCVLELLDLNQEALARELWTLAPWTRVPYFARTYMWEAFHWWANPWRLLDPIDADGNPLAEDAA